MAIMDRFFVQVIFTQYIIYGNFFRLLQLYVSNYLAEGWVKLFCEIAPDRVKSAFLGA